MRKLGQKKGFTLVELSLSIAFIAILSITVALIINNAISTYRRGITLNQVNTVGMDLVDDMRAAIQNSPATAVTRECGLNYGGAEEEDCKNDGARGFVVVRRLGDISEVGENVPAYGALCTGTYSYIWNSGYFYSENDFDELSGATLKYKDIDDGVELISDFRLLKIKDRSRAVCISAMKAVGGDNYLGGEFDVGNLFDISEYDVVTEEPEVLLSNDNSNPLALYDLDAPAPATNGAGSVSYYSVSFILGTVQGGINVMSTGNFCKPPKSGDSSENFDYCAINKFNFAVQAIGG